MLYNTVRYTCAAHRAPRKGNSVSRMATIIDLGTLLLIISTVAMLALGQVLFKYASEGVVLSQPLTLLSFPLVAALAVYGVATVAWLAVLARVPLSLAFPFYGLAFLLVPLFAWALLREPLRPQVFIGGLVILIGVAITSLGTRP